MSLTNLKEIILIAALHNRLPTTSGQDVAQEFSASLPSAFGGATYPKHYSGIAPVLLSHQQRVEQIKGFLLDEPEKGANHKAAVLENLIWRKDGQGQGWKSEATRKEEWDLRGRVLAVARGDAEDDAAITILAECALQKNITPADITAELEAIHESRRRMAARDSDSCFRMLISDKPSLCSPSVGQMVCSPR